MSFESGIPEEKSKWMFQNIPPEFKSSRDYSKKHHPKRRQERADKIRKERTAYFNEKNLNKISARERYALIEEEKSRVVEEMRDTKKYLNRAANKLRLNIFEKIFSQSKSKIKERKFAKENVEFYEGSLTDKIKKLEKIEEEIKWLAGTINDTVRTNKLSSLRKEMLNSINLDNKFYDREHKMYEQKIEKRKRHILRINEEEPYRNVEYFAKQENVFFVHGTNPKFTPSINSLIVNDLPWYTKVKIAIGLQPTLSTSTIRPGHENFENAFAGVGLMIGNGGIEHVSRTDAASVRHSVTEFTALNRYNDDTDESRERNTPTLNFISDVLKKGPLISESFKHNEIIVSNPKVVGIYFTADNISDEVLQKVYYVPDHSEIKTLSDETNLPVFAFKDGKFYRTDYNKENGTYLCNEGEELSPETITKLPGIDPETRCKIFNNINDDREKLFKTNLDLSENTQT